MKIALFNTTGTISCDGSRLISALLKRAGHSVKTILLTRNNDVPYQAGDLEGLSEVLKECDLAMFAVYSRGLPCQRKLLNLFIQNTRA